MVHFMESHTFKQNLQPGAWTALSLKLFTVENGKHPQREGGTSIQAGFNS